MRPHPVRLVVRNATLERSRLTTFFRIILLIPHIVWLALWSIAVLVAAVVNWVIALALGRTPTKLHGFFAAWVRYWVHVMAYAALLTDDWPGFAGRQFESPIDLEVDPPAPQSRLTILVRGLLALPACVLAGTLGAGSGLGSSFSNAGRSNRGGDVSGGVLAVVAFLSWFSILVRGRQPEGLRNLGLFSLRYSAQTYAYLLLLTPRYPDATPAERPVVCEVPGHPVALAADDDGRRSRLLVFFRLPLAIPHLIWLVLWGILAILASIAGWLVALVSGSLPLPLHRFLSAYLRYYTHVTAFFSVVGNPFPGFTGAPGSYPIDAVLPPAPERQSRWTVLIRVILALPALLVASALGNSLCVCAVLLWFTGLFLGRVPAQLVTLGAFVLRYSAQTNAYLLLLTPRYPYSGPWTGASPEPEPVPSPALPDPQVAF